MEKWRFWPLRFDFSSVSCPLVDLRSGEKADLPISLEAKLTELLKRRRDKSGVVNVTAKGELVNSMVVDDVHDGMKATVLAVHEDWLQLTDNLILSLPQTPVSAGSFVLLTKPNSQEISLGVLNAHSGSSLPIEEIIKLHSLYFGEEGESLEKDRKTVEEYPETVGTQRIRIEKLKLLKPFKQSFQVQVEELKKEFSSWRKSRGDGNCYYRAVSFTYLEYLCREAVSVKLLKEFYMKLYLQREQFSLKEVSERYDREFLWAIRRMRELIMIKERTGSAVQQLDYIYQNDLEFDRAMVRILKIATYNHLKRNASAFESFLSKPLAELLSEVLADGVESEGIVFQAIADMLDVVLVHILLPDSSCTVYREEFRPPRPGRKAVLSLLLRPGHYDILYPVQADFVDRYNFTLENYSGFDVSVGECYQLYKLVE